MKRFIYLLLALLLIFPVFAVPQGKASSLAVIDPLVSKALDTASSLQVIVTFKGDGAPTTSQLALLDTLGIETGISMKSLPIAGVIATKAQIEKLAANPEVQSIYMNKKLTYFNADATAITGVDKARTDDSFRKANGGLPVSGKGIGVVVNDSGVDGTNKDHELGKNLVQNVMGSTNLNALAPGLLPVTYQENVPNTDTNSGHGTHVAGTVGGTGAMSGGKYEGAAPGADLIGYGSGAALFVLDGIGGFDYAITHQSQYNIRVITNSWVHLETSSPTIQSILPAKKRTTAELRFFLQQVMKAPAKTRITHMQKLHGSFQSLQESKMERWLISHLEAQKV